MECDKCGDSRDRKYLFDAISGEGIIRVCEKCLSKENIPIIQKKEIGEQRETKREVIYDLPSKKRGFEFKENISIKKQDSSLREVVENKMKQGKVKELKMRKDLVENFHWIIMRARRLKHMTQKQFAEAINESEEVVRMAEKGIVPEKGYKLINKIENKLGIRIIKKEFIEQALRNITNDFSEIQKQEQPEKEIKFDELAARNLTISDLKGIDKKREEEIFNSPSPEELSEKNTDEEYLDLQENQQKKEKDLSQRDIDDLIFRR